MAKSKILTDVQETQLDAVKTVIKNNIRDANFANKLQVACENFKYAFVEAIKIAEDKGKQSLTTSSCHINLFHEVVKSELIRNGVKENLIFPRLNSSNGELKLTGFIKAKKQDITVVSNIYAGKETPEQINSGMMAGQTDRFGKDFTEHSLVINVRSQMSSIRKNDDTIFERAFAETLNLHMRCPNMVLGELFILPITGFDIDKVKDGKPEFEKIVFEKVRNNSITTAEAVERNINTYKALNGRNSKEDEAYKYERVCLILADFSQFPVKIYKNVEQLRDDKLLPENSDATMEGIGFDNFISDLLEIYSERFEEGRFI